MLNRIRWLISGNGHSPEYADIVVSSRVRIARNVRQFNFDVKLKPADAERLLQFLRTTIDSRIRGEYIDIQQISPLERESLLECHLISPAFLRKEKPTGLYIADEGDISIMLNEEDHLRMQALSAGMNVQRIADKIFALEDSIGAELDFSFDETYGYITSCPTNIGTGFRGSVLLHLPGLVYTNEVEKVLKGALQIGMAVRGIYGEGSEIKGSLFQISNQHTLGLKEEDLLQTITKLTSMIVDIEKKARDVIFSKARHEFEDKIFRSIAILRSARIISTDEVLNLLSAVRFGIGTGILKEVDLAVVNEIMLVSRPANIQLFYNEIFEEHERDIRRADFIRNRLSGKKI